MESLHAVGLKLSKAEGNKKPGHRLIDVMFRAKAKLLLKQRNPLSTQLQ